MSREALACGMRMGRKLGLNFGCGTERRICWIDGNAVPICLQVRVLLGGIGIDQTGICRKALATHQAIRDAPCDGLLKQMRQQFALAETSTPVLREGRMVQHRIGQIETTKPAVCQVQMHQRTQGLELVVRSVAAYSSGGSPLSGTAHNRLSTSSNKLPQRRH